MEIKQLLDALKNILKNAEKLDNKDNVLVNVPLEDIPTIVDTLEKQVSQEVMAMLRMGGWCLMNGFVFAVIHGMKWIMMNMNIARIADRKLLGRS